MFGSLTSKLENFEFEKKKIPHQKRQNSCFFVPKCMFDLNGQLKKI